MYHDSSQSPLLTSTFAIQGDLSLSNKEIIERLARLEEGQKASVDKLEYRKINKSEIRIPACMAWFCEAYACFQGGIKINRIQKENLGKFFVDMAKVVLTIFVISGLIPATKIPLIFVISGLLMGIILLIIGITILKGAEEWLIK